MKLKDGAVPKVFAFKQIHNITRDLLERAKRNEKHRVSLSQLISSRH